MPQNSCFFICKCRIEYLSLLLTNTHTDMKHIPEVLKKIDWAELRSQKEGLLKTIDEIEKFKNPSEESNERIGELNGLVALLDALQDYAVDEIGVPELYVFDLEVEDLYNS